MRAYIDRYGISHDIDSSIRIRDRSGAWLVCICDDKILFTHPDYAPDVPDLPGGGIDEGETALMAAIRELNEETELTIQSPQIVKQHHQFVHFFAEDVPEYWNYDQTYFLVRNGLEHLVFDGKKKVVEGYCEWIPIHDLSQYTIHHMHKKALIELGVIEK